eukprot:3349051-Pleurochrysis_carterae.AAC.1
MESLLRSNRAPQGSILKLSDTEQALLEGVAMAAPSSASSFDSGSQASDADSANRLYGSQPASDVDVQESSAAAAPSCSYDRTNTLKRGSHENQA